MSDYFIRVRMTWLQIQAACELISTKVDRMVVYEHVPEGNEDNTHVHMYLTDTQVSTDTLKNYIKRSVTSEIPKVKGNEFWSFKTEYTPFGQTINLPIDEKCITYMSKGKLDPVYVKGFTQDEINVYRDQWDPTIKAAPSKKQSKLMYVVKETHKESKLRQNEMIDEIIKRLHESKDTSSLAIIKTIRQVVIVEQNTICGRYKVRDYHDTIIAKLNSDNTWINYMMQMVMM